VSFALIYSHGYFISLFVPAFLLLMFSQGLDYTLHINLLEPLTRIRTGFITIPHPDPAIFTVMLIRIQALPSYLKLNCKKIFSLFTREVKFLSCNNLQGYKT
jgi:hypothetical protein